MNLLKLNSNLIYIFENKKLNKNIPFAKLNSNFKNTPLKLN